MRLAKDGEPIASNALTPVRATGHHRAGNPANDNQQLTYPPQPCIADSIFSQTAVPFKLLESRRAKQIDSIEVITHGCERFRYMSFN